MTAVFEIFYTPLLPIFAVVALSAFAATCCAIRAGGCISPSSPPLSTRHVAVRHSERGHLVQDLGSNSRLDSTRVAARFLALIDRPRICLYLEKAVSPMDPGS